MKKQKKSFGFPVESLWYDVWSTITEKNLFKSNGREYQINNYV